MTIQFSSQRSIHIAVFVGLSGLAFGCSSDSSSSTPNTDAGAGGAGGSSSSSGGAKATGGASSSGGAKATGGASSSGGAKATGGTSAAGGSGGAATGGASSTDAGNDAGYVPPTPKLPQAVGYIAGGTFKPLGSYTGITGKAHIIRTAAGATTVELHVEGLTASTAYPAHVHALPCAVDSGGGHYKIDPSVAATDPANELHIGFTTDATGVGHASVNNATHAARPDAQSIVIHDPAAANAKMACVDLLAEPVATVTATGTLAPFAGATALDRNLGGTATLVRKSSGTTVTLDVSGLVAGETYMSHVHALPCAVTTAGGHYKIDPTVTAATEANELWPALQADSGNPTLSVAHVARPDAQSVVVHRVVSGTAVKVACADLVRVEAYLPYKTEGTAVLIGGGGGFPNLVASATMTRTLPTTTDVTLTVTGLGNSLQYGAHVHTLSCGNQNGGGHYKIDTTVATTQQANELWVPVTTNGTGAGNQTFSIATHLARPEAASVVIHDSTTPTTRLACIDLL